MLPTAFALDWFEEQSQDNGEEKGMQRENQGVTVMGRGRGGTEK